MDIELIVGGFILNSDRELLVISGDKWSSKYVVPGGHVEPGESVESALTREIIEETGLVVTVEKFLGVQEAIKSNFAPNRHMVFLDYLCSVSTKEITESDEAKRHHWLNASNLDAVNLGEFTRRGIERYGLFELMPSDPDFDDSIDAARKGIKKYRNALSKLAK